MSIIVVIVTVTVYYVIIDLIGPKVLSYENSLKKVRITFRRTKRFLIRDYMLNFQRNSLPRYRDN